MSRPSEFARHAFLSSRSPEEAARILVEGDFYLDEEPPLLFAMRRHPGVDLDDDAMLSVVFDLFEEHEDDPDALTAAALLDRLAEASRQRAARRR